MEVKLTAKKQQQLFETGKVHFFEGEYSEAESIFRLLKEQSQLQRDYRAFVKNVIWLNRVCINTSQFEELYANIFLIYPYLKKYASEEQYYFYRMQKNVLNSVYAIGDSMTDFKELFYELRQKPYHSLTFIVGSNYLYILLENNRAKEALQLLEQLKPLYVFIENENKMTGFMHAIYEFLVFFINEDYEQAAAIIYKIENDHDIKIVDSLDYTFYMSKALMELQLGNVEYAKVLCNQVLESVPNLEYIRLEIRLWVKMMQQYQLFEDVIYYQKVYIEMLEAQYNCEVKQRRKESIEKQSLQNFEGRLYVDSLTKVHNRNYYDDLLSKLQKVINFTIIVLDIDNFKMINDQYGHTAGDLAIKHIATHLQENIPRHDIAVVRYGGDEFVVLIPYSLHVMQDAINELHRKIMASSLNLPKQQETIKVSVSVGISYTDDEYCTIQQLFEQADEALYFAKKNRGSIYIFEK